MNKKDYHEPHTFKGYIMTALAIIKSGFTRLFLVALILASAIIPLLPEQNTAHAQDMSAWNFYKTLTINGSSNASTSNYVMTPLVLHSGNGTDNSTDIYLNNHANSDFSDVRFTDNASNLLSFFVENYPPLEHGGVSQPLHPTITDPMAISYNGTTYAVWQSGLTTPQPFIASYNESTGVWSKPVQIANDSPLTGDDHGPPAIIRDSLGYLHVTYGAHDNNNLKYARSTNPNDISSWTPEPDLVSVATYSRWIMSSNGTLYNFYRTDPGLDQSTAFIMSVDNGATWSAEQRIVTVNNTSRIYGGNMAYDSNNGTIHMGWTIANLADTVRQNLYEAYLKLSNSHMYSENGTDLGTNIDYTEMQANNLVYTSLSSNVTNPPTVRLDNNGFPYMMATVQDTSIYHHEIISWNGSGWSTMTVIANTNGINNSQDFLVETSSNITAYLVTGGIISTNSNARGGDIQKFTYNGTWSSPTTVLTANDSSYPLDYPRIVYGSNPPEIVFTQMETDYYGFSDLQLYLYRNGVVTAIIPKTMKVWVKVPSIPLSSSTTINIYYGNNSASAYSNAGDTFSYFNNGITGNMTKAESGGGNITNYAPSFQLKSVETGSGNAFEYGNVTSGNLSWHWQSVHDSYGNDSGNYHYGLLDVNSVASVIGLQAAFSGKARFIIARYNDETSTPSDIVMYYYDPASALKSWNGTAWQGVLTHFAIRGTVDINISISSDTVYADVTQHGVSIFGGQQSVPLSSIKPFATGMVAAFGEPYTDNYYVNSALSSIFVRPFIYPQPAWGTSSSEQPSAPPVITTLPSTNVSMTKDGLVTGNFSGNLTSTSNSTANVTYKWDFGNTLGYGMSTVSTSTNTTGVKTLAFSTSNLTPGETAHARFTSTNAFGTANGSDSTFTLTLPSVTTGTVTNVGMNGGTHATLNAEITSMGVATDTYTSFQYSTDLSFSQSTPEVVQAAIGTYSATITGFLPNQFYNVRAVNRVGAVSTYGATQTFFTNATATFNLLDTTIILVVVALIFFILSMMLLPAETPLIFRMILIAVATYFVLAILPGLQNILSALQ